MPVELRWDGKYNPDGTRSAPLRVALPFQTVETVNESAQERQRALDLFGGGRPSDWRNRLIWGDKKYVLPSLLAEFAGQVNLIYIDPPFATGADFSFQVEIEDARFTKEPSVIEQKAYRDTWGRGLDSYLQWFYETVALLHELLADDGSIYVHLDYHVSQYAKVVMDEVFGSDNFQAEIVWKRTTAHNDSRNYGTNVDSILYFSKTEKRTWTQLFVSHSEEYLARFRNVDPDGRRWQDGNLTAKGLSGGGYEYEYKGVKSNWRMPLETMRRLDAENRLHFTKNGGIRLKFYLDEAPGISLQSLWDDISPVNSQAGERVSYPTQKPEALLERIIRASSNEGDLVLDCFAGSGTTAAVAEKLNRRWITCDLGRFAIHTTRKRLLDIANVRPFVVQNLGKYERQVWQADEFGPNAAQRIARYTRFILDLYHVQPLSGYTWLHGVKGGRVVHVGAVDTPVTLADVRSLVIEWRRNLGQTGATSAGLDVLGWDFAFELNETAKQQAAEAGVDLRFLTIPREVLEKKAVQQGDIQFFELAALFLDHHVEGRHLALTLTNFIPPLEYVPPEVREKMLRWEAWIDYWAVDWDFKGDTFHNEWQSYRTRKNKGLQTTITHTYAEPGVYRVQVKVIDILGNDTTRTMEVAVG